MPTPREILAQARRDALDMANRAGLERTKTVLQAAESELMQRLAVIRSPLPTFTYEQSRQALMQVRFCLINLKQGMTNTLLSNADTASQSAAGSTIEYMERLERSFRGLGVAPLDLNTASMYERARVGARASILRRLTSDGEEGGPEEPHKAKQGILDRYGMNTIGDFEATLQKAVITRKPWAEVRAELVTQSPFLKGKPGFWAERIVRTETMGSYNRGSWEANREADDQLGDMCKILSATFDDRTAADSYAVHGQIRRPDQAFQSWFGLYQHPPNRPNDREVVVPHRVSWPIPDFLQPKSDAEVRERWVVKEKRKAPLPARPTMTTIDRDLFGKKRPPKTSEKTEPRKPIPPERLRLCRWSPPLIRHLSKDGGNPNGSIRGDEYGPGAAGDLVRR